MLSIFILTVLAQITRAIQICSDDNKQEYICGCYCVPCKNNKLSAEQLQNLARDQALKEVKRLGLEADTRRLGNVPVEVFSAVMPSVACFEESCPIQAVHESQVYRKIDAENIFSDDDEDALTALISSIVDFDDEYEPESEYIEQDALYEDDECVEQDVAYEEDECVEQDAAYEDEFVFDDEFDELSDEDIIMAVIPVLMENDLAGFGDTNQLGAIGQKIDARRCPIRLEIA
ncbi:hypothetical protein ACOME3_004915 [Neoechinorhynchus agilis]